MNKLITIISLVALMGCSDQDISIIDQCKRIELFDSCMQSLPPGPKATHYNDWSEVVNSCSTYATYASYRRKDLVKLECRA